MKKVQPHEDLMEAAQRAADERRRLLDLGRLPIRTPQPREPASLPPTPDPPTR